MNNYDTMRRDAEQRFLSYSIEELLRNPGLTDAGLYVQTAFFGCTVRISKKTGAGEMQRGNKWEKLDFSQTLSVLDYICDRKSGSFGSGVFCPIGSLPGIFVGGRGLSMQPSALADLADKNPEAFHSACRKFGGVETGQGDIGYRLLIFPDLQMELKFYRADEDFPAQITLFWDKNSLQFVRYETLYYIAGALVRLLTEALIN